MPDMTFIEIVSGPAAGQRIQVSTGELVIGREGDHDLAADPDLSRTHARISKSPTGLTVEDLASTNGTWVNGDRIERVVPLAPGDRVRLGSSEFEVLDGKLNTPTNVQTATTELATREQDQAPPAPSPASFEDMFERGRVLLQQGHAGAAVTAFRELIAADPSRPEGHYAAGVALLQLGQNDEAEASLEAALARNAANPNGHFQLGQIAERREDWSAAGERYSRALALAPDHAGARERVQELVATGRISPVAMPGPAAAEESQGDEGPARSLAEALERQKQAGAPASADDLEAAGRGELLLDGRRRLSSFFKHLAIALALLLGGVVAVPAIINPLQDGLRDGAATDGGKETLLDILQTIEDPLSLALVLAAAALAIWAVLASMSTRYQIYARRIDISTGVLFRRQSSVWLYDITDVDYERDPFLILGGTGAIALQSESQKVSASAPRNPKAPPPRDPNTDRIVGIGTHDEMQKLWHNLRNSILHERRSMKQLFV